MAEPPFDAVFVDRDGTLNAAAPSGDYVARAAALRLLPGVSAAVRRLNDAGVEVHVVTNQRGVALGRSTEADVESVNQRVAELLALEAGARLDSVQHCPHEAGTCACRKPGDGMIRTVLAARPYLRPRRCAVVGDSPADAAAGTALGLLRVLCTGGTTVPDQTPDADLVVQDLPAAVERLLAEPTPRRSAR